MKKDKKRTCYPHLEPMNSCKTAWTIAPDCCLDDLYRDELYELCKSGLLRIAELDARLTVSQVDYDKEFTKNVKLTEELLDVQRENLKLANENEKLKSAKFVIMEEMAKAQRERNESVDRCVKADLENDKLLDQLGKAVKEVEQYRGQCNVLEHDMMSTRRALSELQVSHTGLFNRLRHLLESEFIRAFDEYDIKTGTYKRDISEADKLVTSKFIGTNPPADIAEVVKRIHDMCEGIPYADWDICYNAEHGKYNIIIK